LFHNFLVIAYLALGSNLGDRRAYMESATRSLSRQGVRIVRSASVYLTEPHEISDQPWFLNTVVEVNTMLGPEQLLTVCLAVEEEHSRKRTGTKESRTLDIDIIFYGDHVLENPHLMIPHPKFRNRRFVLEPLAEIAPDFIDPVSGKTVRQLFEAVADTAEVRHSGPPLL
jgi:2-amino-4-hydroxy-6-hydroxymethyldihydropteridine diphosphokinase